MLIIDASLIITQLGLHNICFHRFDQSGFVFNLHYNLDGEIQCEYDVT